MKRKTRQRGFTLLEIAIAMAILGIGVVSALQVFGSSMQLARAASRKSEAVVHAKALMDAAMWVPQLADNISHGEIGNGFRWQRTIRHAGPADGVPDTETPLDIRLAVITVQVEWTETTGVKSYQIGTMRVVPQSD